MSDQVPNALEDLEPLEDIVIIEQAIEEKSHGGLILAGGAEKLTAGWVVAVGPGRTYSTYLDASGHTQFAYTVPTKVRIGDYVTFGKYQSGGEPIEYKGKRYLMAREGDLGLKSKTPISIRLWKD